MSRLMQQKSGLKQTNDSSVSQKAAAKSQPPGSPLHANLLQMQQTLGNQATGQLLAQQIQRKSDASAAQLKGNPEEEELQMKVDDEELQMKAVAPVQRKGSGHTMPEEVQTKMENTMNADFSNVNIHEGNKASDVGALAYAQGNDIHFAQGKFEPNTQSGQELLGHELAHIVQQRQNRVKPTTQAKGLPVNDDPKLEQEADDLGRKAAQAKLDEDELKK